MKYYFTFRSNESHWDKYFVIDAENISAAIREMNATLGDEWGGVYNSAEDAGVERYGLTELVDSDQLDRLRDELILKEEPPDEDMEKLTVIEEDPSLGLLESLVMAFNLGMRSEQKFDAEFRQSLRSKD